ncbi:TetR/AcrR family transcriptional regulator [Mucilaginibacter endophyticus]|uniref:TetR/AcrR family transcriptional regulator n=1 Tax=Mucilaginibacter endophyticus TaxID=2675003 RepID=UPI000E0DA585|nr:TetR/AcrR family transcriptional regulator [Mucilaginibacter endophyticus]
MRTKEFNEDEALEKAMQLFWLKGYNGTSMQDLLDGLGLSRSTLYRAYIDKHSLFLKALGHYQQFSSSEIKKVINEGDTAKETVKKLLEFIAEVVVQDQQHKGCFMLNSEIELSLHDKVVHDMVVNSDQDIEDVFYHVLTKGQKRGEISKAEDARAMAKFFLNTAKGIRATAKSNPDKKVFKDIIALAIKALN